MTMYFLYHHPRAFTAPLEYIDNELQLQGLQRAAYIGSHSGKRYPSEPAPHTVQITENGCKVLWAVGTEKL